MKRFFCLCLVLILTGAGANQNPAVIVLDVLAGRALSLSQFLNRLNH